MTAPEVPAKDGQSPVDAEHQRLLVNAEVVLRRVAPGLMGAVLRQRCRTSDLVQSALADAIASLPSFRGSSDTEFVGWTVRILEHNTLDRTRRLLADRRRVDREVADEEGGPLGCVVDRARSPSQVAIDREQLARMAKAMRRLPAEQRRILQIVALRGCSHAEASRSLGRSEEACRVLLARARASLLVTMARLVDDGTS